MSRRSLIALLAAIVLTAGAAGMAATSAQSESADGSRQAALAIRTANGTVPAHLSVNGQGDGVDAGRTVRVGDHDVAVGGLTVVLFLTVWAWALGGSREPRPLVALLAAVPSRGPPFRLALD